MAFTRVNFTFPLCDTKKYFPHINVRHSEMMQTKVKFDWQQLDPDFSVFQGIYTDTMPYQPHHAEVSL
jgi:hypothetical protein